MTAAAVPRLFSLEPVWLSVDLLTRGQVLLI